MIKPGMFISERYEIIDKVGSGGMADVYKAKCHRLNRYVAIKVLKPEYSSDKTFVAKFRAEAQSVAGLSHPNIVNVYDVGDDDGLYYIVMELVEGITLKKFIERKGRLEIKEAVGIAIQIAQGMAAAHDNHIIHRDIKPQNIIISREGKVKVTDFGIAKAASTNTVTQNAVGSVHYLSPEQARGGYSDERSDIYSLGVTIYEMLSGEVPFAGDNSVSVALAHIQGEATPLRELNPEVPVSLEKIVQKCMQKKPERRYLTAQELIADLKRSITNKDGDYVVINNGTVSDSPTIHMTDDEMNHIKSAAKTPVTLYDNNVKDKQVEKLDKEEEEELDTVDSKVEKVLVIGMIGAAVLLAAAVLIVVFKFLNVFGGSKKGGDATPTPTITIEATITPTEDATVGQVEMPQVVGLTVDMAKDALNQRSESFQVKFAENEEYSDTIAKGSIMKQDPEPFTMVASNAAITLTISAGAEPVELPNVYNLTFEKAKAMLEEKGLKVADPVYEETTDMNPGMVIRTDPPRSSDVNTPVYVGKGSTVTLYVSKAPDVETVTVPSILGLSESNARAELQKVGLDLGKVTKGPSDVYVAGLVSYQSYTFNTSVAKGTKVDVSISTGRDTNANPTTTPAPADDPTTAPSEPTQEPEDDAEYEYNGTVTIDKNPFAEGESGTVYLELEQDGESTKIFEKTLSYTDFPSAFTNIKVSGMKEGNATVHMYIDDEVFPGSWSVYLRAERVN